MRLGKIRRKDVADISVILIFAGFVLLCCCAYADKFDSLNFQAQQFINQNKIEEGLKFFDTQEDKNYKDYFKAYLLYKQLCLWEKEKNWEDFYSKGSNYRERIIELLSPLKRLSSRNILKIYAYALLGIVYKKNQDPLYQEVFQNLQNLIEEYLEETEDIEGIIKVQNFLYQEGLKTFSRKVYKKLFDFIIASPQKVDYSVLKKIALKTLKENPQFSRSLFRIYLKFIPQILQEKEALFKELKEIFLIFSYKVFKGADFKDILLAKDILDVFSENNFELSPNLKYLKALILEKLKRYKQAYSIYKELLDISQFYTIAPELNFKCFIINFYLTSPKEAMFYLKKLQDDYSHTAYFQIACYLWGLYKQWNRDFEEAQKFYRKASQGVLSEISILAEKRLKEIMDKKPLPLKIASFFDVLWGKLKSEGEVWIQADSSFLIGEDSTHISARMFAPSSGCLQPKVVYLWWGLLGKNKYPSQERFLTSFNSWSIKPIFCGVQTPTGFLKPDFNCINVYNIRIKGIDREITAGKTLNINIDFLPPLYKEIYKFKLSLFKDGQLFKESQNLNLHIPSIPSGNYRLRIQVFSLADYILDEKELKFTVK